LRQQAPQHSAPGAQQSPPSQQSLTFALVLVKPQHACGGLQQSPSGQQLVAFTLVAAKQHACGGLQQSAPGAQQLIFMLDVPPPRMPRSSAKGASSFRVITDLQLI
jgi:hypothetical protein